MSKKPLGGISLPDDADQIMKKLAPQAEVLPSISKTKTSIESEVKADISPRLGKSISLPDYVWEQLRKNAFDMGVPQNVYILHACKAFGLEVKDEDLVDGRTRR